MTGPTTPERRTRSWAGFGARTAAGALAALALGATVDQTSRPPANVERVAIFDGRGFGHGVGMSQWGARGAALQGRTVEQIIAHYYPTTTLQTQPTRALRVLLKQDVPTVTLNATPRLVAVPFGRAVGVPLPKGAAKVTVQNGALRIVAANGATVGSGWSGARFTGQGSLTVNGVAYRGVLRVTATPKGLRVINVVGLENYLRSVVSKEMSPAWDADAAAALRVQAIAARTYALATPAKGDFDVYDDQRSQVYGGVAAEDPRTDRAVRATAGQVIIGAGKPIVAFYSSSSGGRTDSAANIFGPASARPWLVSVDDPFDAIAPMNRWISPPTFSTTELTASLKTVLPIVDLVPTKRGDSPRVLTAKITVTPFGEVQVTGDQLRSALKLPATWFDVVWRTRRPDGSAIPLPADAKPADVWLAVLNGSGTIGAAAKLAVTARGAGYVGVFAGNAPVHTGPDVVYYADGAQPAAQAVATTLGIAQVAPLAQAGTSASAAPKGVNVVVILGKH